MSSAVLWLFGGMLLLQVTLALVRPPPRATIAQMPPAPPAAVLRALSLGESHVISGAIVLFLQAFDDQPGASIPFADLDYTRLAEWLDRALALDPGSDYPLLLASHVYAQARDPGRQRIVLDFVHRAFLADPDRRWRWLAHAAILARHRLHDDGLALRYAGDIARHATQAPGWARQMQIFLLEDVGERDQAKILLGGLLASGAVTDPAEIKFLTGRLESLGGYAAGSGTAAR